MLLSEARFMNHSWGRGSWAGSGADLIRLNSSEFKNSTSVSRLRNPIYKTTLKLGPAILSLIPISVKLLHPKELMKLENIYSLLNSNIRKALFLLSAMKPTGGG